MVAAAVANFISTQLNISVLDDGNLTNLISELTSALQLAGATGLSVGMGVPTNLQLEASVGSNQLTISVVGTNGSVPSASNPVSIPFRNATIATGNVVPETVQAALNFTINSGSTMGVANNNQPFRLWVVAFNNAGTVCLGAVNCSTLTQVFPLNEDALQSSQAGTGGGSTAGLFYANVASLTSLPIRILGYLEWSAGLTGTGVWNAIPTKIQLFGPGQRKPGEVVQAAYATAASSPATITLTPTSQVNPVVLGANCEQSSSGTGVNLTLTLKRGATTVRTAVAFVPTGSGGGAFDISAGPFWDTPQSVSSLSYTANTNGTTTYIDFEAREIMG
jgi:hypothetical protein